MNKLKLIVCFLVLTFFSCRKNEITPPEEDDYNLAGTVPISNVTMKNMEGIYHFISGTDNLGTKFVCKTSKNRVSFFSDKDGIFFILKFGLNPTDSTIQYSGFWRYSETTQQGKIHLSTTTADGSGNILNGIISGWRLTGDFDGNPINFQFDREFSNFTKTNEFMVFAHHGVQTTANPPYAENSLNGVLFDEGYGVNGLEYDIRLTKDNVPICIHDPTINTRLVLKGPLSGSWDQYPFQFLSSYVRLIDNQELPSLEKALEYFVDSTTLKYFWCDIKGNPEVFKYLEPIVRNAYARAVSSGRTVTIFAGLPSSSVIDEFNKQPTYKSTNPAYSYSQPLPTLCEETMDKVLENGSQFFGPRYTTGLLLEDVERAHANGVKVISWTLNSKTLIVDYLTNGNFDGFITDYPAYVVYNYYTMY